MKTLRCLNCLCSGQQMHADQDPGGLLLLRVGHAHLQAEPRSQHRQDGARHDSGHQVVVRHSLLCHSHSRYIVGIGKLFFHAGK